jgi:hypothetical protein
MGRNRRISSQTISQEQMEVEKVELFDLSRGKMSLRVRKIFPSDYFSFPGYDSE